jgi:mono/diheme cytochrome c family protein
MNSAPTERQFAGPPEQEPAPATSGHVLRQVVVIIVVVAVWSALLVGYLALTDTSEEAPAATAEPTVASFSSDVLPVFEARCQRCHGTGRAEAGLRLTSHADVMAGSDYGAVVIPGNAATSRLVEVIVSGEMPLGGQRLPETDIQIIRNWVDAGAPDN